MEAITPAEFWRRYREEVRRNGSWAAYTTSKKWTSTVIDAAERVSKSFGLEVSREYLRLDCAGYELRVGSHCDDWDLRIAFEHESGVRKGKDWRDELCKLSHVVADLRVLVGYCVLRKQSVTSILQERIQTIKDRIMRVADSHWLFILGSGDDLWCLEPWQAFTLDSDGGVERLHDDQPFSPSEWKSLAN